MGEFFMDDSYLENRDFSRSNKITVEMLETNGFERNTIQERLINEAGIPEYSCFEKNIGNKYFLQMQLGVSNMAGRNWSIHIDDSSRNSIGGADIETVEHFNLCMKLFEINFKL
jgi:hypothetical protein